MTLDREFKDFLHIPFQNYAAILLQSCNFLVCLHVQPTWLRPWCFQIITVQSELKYAKLGTHNIKRKKWPASKPRNCSKLYWVLKVTFCSRKLALTCAMWDWRQNVHWQYFRYLLRPVKILIVLEDNLSQLPHTIIQVITKLTNTQIIPQYPCISHQ